MAYYPGGGYPQQQQYPGGGAYPPQAGYQGYPGAVGMQGMQGMQMQPGMQGMQGGYYPGGPQGGVAVDPRTGVPGVNAGGAWLPANLGYEYTLPNLGYVPQPTMTPYDLVSVPWPWPWWDGMDEMGWQGMARGRDDADDDVMWLAVMRDYHANRQSTRDVMLTHVPRRARPTAPARARTRRTRSTRVSWTEW